MIWLALASLVCAVGPALLFARNLAALHPPPQAAGSPAAVLIPARDEERNIGPALKAALASGAAEVIVLDDGSTDGTAEIVRQKAARESRVRLIASRPLPEGWLGKNFACAQLAEAATQPVLIFVDADVRLAAGSSPRLAAFLQESGASLASGVPRQETVTFSERLLLPLIQFLLLGFLPLGRMRASRHPAYGTGCGQLFVANAEAYRACGGHGAIRQRVHDGLALPKKFREHGFATDLFDATAIATCRMYRNNAEVWRGLAKNAHAGLGAPRVILPMTALLLLGQVAPFILLFAPGPVGARVLAAIAIVSVMWVRLICCRRFAQPLSSAALHPLGMTALLAVQWFGLGRFLLGRPAFWKGRELPASARVRKS